jgi:hypothetical protein
MTNSNNIGQVLDSSRLTNTLLENKIREGSDMSTKINDINNGLNKDFRGWRGRTSRSESF